MHFGRKKSPPIRSLIAEHTVVGGPIRFSDGLRIDGEVQGDVLATSETKPRSWAWSRPRM